MALPRLSVYLLGIAIPLILVAHPIFVYAEARIADGEKVVIFREIGIAFWYVSGDEDQTLHITSLSKGQANREITVEVLSLPLVPEVGKAQYKKGALSQDQEQSLSRVLQESASVSFKETHKFPGTTTTEHPAWLQGKYTTAERATRHFKTVLNVYPEKAANWVEATEAGQVLRLIKAIRNFEILAIETGVGDLAIQEFQFRLSESYNSCPAELRPFLAKGLVLVGKFSEVLLQDTDPSVRIYALWGLVETSPQEARKYLRRALEDPEPSVREFAQEQLNLSN